jgi:hypothetical protein
VVRVECLVMEEGGQEFIEMPLQHLIIMVYLMHLDSQEMVSNVTWEKLIVLYLIPIHQTIVHLKPITGEEVEAREEITQGDPIMLAEKAVGEQVLLQQELVREIRMESTFRQILCQKHMQVMEHRILVAVVRLVVMAVLVLPLLLYRKRRSNNLVFRICLEISKVCVVSVRVILIHTGQKAYPID